MNQGIAGIKTDAQCTRGNAETHRITIRHHYHVECVRAGQVVWTDDYDNLVVTAGLQKYLDATLKTGLAAPLWFVGLITGPGSGNTYAAADTMASHAGWTENQAYTNATRPAWTPGSISGGAPASVDNSGAKATFVMNASATIAGCFMTDSATKG